MQVRKIMTKNPACCTPDSTLQEVAHMMEMYDCGCIPVINDHQEKRPVGTITDRDITIRTFSKNQNPLEMKASDIMTTDIVTVTPETSVDECMNVMESKQIRRVLVVDKDGKCTGIVAQADLAEHVTSAAETGKFIKEVSETESDRSRERNYESNRSPYNEGRYRQGGYSFSENQSRDWSQETYRRPHVEKQSFFNSTTLLTLLGSIGIGAGLRYYLGPEVNDKPRSPKKHENKTGDFDTKITVGKKTTDSSLNSTVTTTPPVAGSIDSTSKRDTITGTVDSFNTIDDDPDLKPITEIGRTAGNT